MATSIDTLIDEMTALVDGHRERSDPSGYFAAMYLGVTHTVRDGVRSGRFDTPLQIERLTVAFANRYLDAARSDAPTASWAVAFDAASDDAATVIQHLLLGMNAHINLDLGVATASVARTGSLDDIRHDFDEINDVLASLVSRVQASLSQVSWLYRFVDDVGDSTDDAVINFSIGRARSQAWKLAVDLAPMDVATSTTAIEQHDRTVAALGRVIARPPWWTRTGLRVLKFTERTSVPDVIDRFARVATEPM